MTLEKIQTTYGFRTCKLPCFNQEEFLCNSISQLKVINFPAFIIFSKEEYTDDSKQDKIETFISAIFYKLSDCEETDIPKDATKIYVYSSLTVKKEEADSFFVKLASCNELKLQRSISTDYKYPYNYKNNPRK